MLEELKEEEIVNKVGGRFKLSTLIQKRLVQLNQGSRALVNVDAHDKMTIVLQEIMQDKMATRFSSPHETLDTLSEEALLPYMSAAPTRTYVCAKKRLVAAQGSHAQPEGAVTSLRTCLCR